VTLERGEARNLPVPRILAFGDGAVIVDLGLPPGRQTSRLVHDLTRHLTTRLSGTGAAGASRHAWEPPVPAASSILLPIDPVDPGVDAARRTVTQLIESWTPTGPPGGERAAGVVEIPVSYGGDDGPDLDEVASRTGLSPDAIVATHSNAEYEVSFLGFAPGFAYLGPLPRELRLPRRREPRARVPAGSVAIGGPQTSIYPTEGPGGWWLIGRTSLPVWDPSRQPPALLAPGMRVRFLPVPGT
jgi:inhibitor of KinA